MNQNQRHEIAKAMTEQASQMNERFNQVLQELGFGEFEITEFRVAPRGDQSKILETLEMAEPCRTRCVLTPSGGIRCFPQC